MYKKNKQMFMLIISDKYIAIYRKLFKKKHFFFKKKKELKIIDILQ
jgi:hypothetical protein